MRNNQRRNGTILLGVCVFAGMAGALPCVRPEPTPAPAEQPAPCMGCGPGGTYLSFPGNDVCVDYMCGFDVCVFQGFMVKRGTNWTGGVLDPATGCCVGGVGAQSTATTTVSVLMGSGECGWCYGGGGGEN